MMTRKELNIQYTKAMNRIEKQDDLLRKSVHELKRLEDENDGLRLSLLSARMFATALMLLTKTESAEFTREELDDIVENKMIDFKEIRNEANLMTGIRLEIPREVVLNYETEVSNSETEGKRTRKPRQRKVDRSEDTIQTGNNSLDGAPTDERQH